MREGRVVWLTGLSGAGKSTLCESTAGVLRGMRMHVQVLDGDQIRAGLSSNLGFSLADREENIRRVAEVAKLFQRAGMLVLVAAICPTEAMRLLVRDILPGVTFVFIDAPLSVCEARDKKGLYRRAREKDLQNFTGISSPFEAPLHPSLTCSTATETVEESTEKIVMHVTKTAS